MIRYRVRGRLDVELQFVRDNVAAQLSKGNEIILPAESAGPDALCLFGGDGVEKIVGNILFVC
ncbi:hypothetical protein GGR51DRAFT_495525 [Nemania sp. FL0031]|nr:hypothetical protein GGR51DRAFT_495525 [Nemania sp. FL0031]